MLRKTILVLGILVSVVAGYGATPPPWPPISQPEIQLTFEPVSGDHLPEGVSLYHKSDNETPDETAARIVNIAQVHLSAGKEVDLIVKADEGGSAGTYYDIYKKKDGGYETIGWLGAGFNIKILAKYNGYHQIEFWSRGGGGSYVRLLYRYIKGQYKCIRIDDYERAEYADDVQQMQQYYVGTRKPDDN